MEELPFFFAGGESRLFGILHETRERPARRGFVFCHPFGEEKLWAHRPGVSFARELAGRGHAVLRFDCRGNGDSDGDFRDSSVGTAVADLGRAVDELKARTGLAQVGLLGLRLGASVAALLAEARDDISQLVLWAPVVDGTRYAQELLLINLATQMAIYKAVRTNRAALVQGMREGRTANVDGYEMSLRMFEELSDLKLAGEPKRFPGPCLVAQIDRAPDPKPSEELKSLVRMYRNATLLQAQEDPFWKEIERLYEKAPNLFGGTVAWLEAR